MSAMTITQRMPAALRVAMEWAAREGWNPGLGDAPCFAAADPSGFFLGEIDAAPVATISVVKYGSTFAFLGLYIVAPAFRGRGHGLSLWQAALASAVGRNVGLDGVVAQQENYRRSGFRLAYRNVRFRGRAPSSSAALSSEIVDAASVPFAALVAYDASHFAVERPAFLRAWIEQAGARALVAQVDGKVAGFGMIRPAHGGFKIGPLFADDERRAEALFGALCAVAGSDADVDLDVPEPNAAGMALARRHAMTPVFETARMYTGPAPAVPLHHVYGVTTFELG